jgi:hypothetical protein
MRLRVMNVIGPVSVHMGITIFAVCLTVIAGTSFLILGSFLYNLN